MAQRKSLSKKIRFEVFKRDNFTCQYCGSKAPDKILEIDHMHPVSKGGKDDIMNLITSCYDCNRGKSDRKLSDGSILEKQRIQIEELNLRRQQLEMMLEWKTGLDSIKNQEAEALRDHIELTYGFGLPSDLFGLIKKNVKKFGFDTLLKAIDISFHKNYDSIYGGFILSVKKSIAIANMEIKPDHIKKIAYIKGILRNRRVYFDESSVHSCLLDYYNNGNNMDDIISFCKTVRDPEELFNHVSQLVF